LITSGFGTGGNRLAADIDAIIDAMAAEHRDTGGWTKLALVD
jgi:hypothetical protein